jgi:predicted transposase/invertase (TIGR01784 family)
MLAEDSKGELMIIEVQNSRELSYFHRMLYGVSKAITEYINEKEGYEKIKKLYSINIVYFSLGQGKDYIYHGYTEFRGMNKNDVLKLSQSQMKQFLYEDAGKLFPEYYVLRVNEFDKNAVSLLDEWISFLKTGEIPENPRAKGLAEARERLQTDKLNKEELAAYNAHVESVQFEKSVIQTSLVEGREIGMEEGKAIGLEEGLEKGEAIGLEKGKAIGAEKTKVEIVIASSKAGLSIETIVGITGLTADKISEILKQ